MTPAIAQLRLEVFAAFPEARDLGVFNCRKIAGTSSWSQHAFGNALDIGVPTRAGGVDWSGRDRGDTFVGYDTAYGDRVFGWLIDNRERLGLGSILWRQPAHWDHLHVEGAPRRRGLPPCAGGPVVGAPEGTTTGGAEVDMAKLPMVRQGDRGGQVAIVQGLLLAHGHGPQGLLNAAGHPDGIFGPGTEGQVQAFQRNHTLTADGIVGARTWAALLGIG